MTAANKSKIPSIRPASVSARGSLPERAFSPANCAATTSTGTSRLPRRQSEKPLPSPPVAQVVDPNSPPKASRTLVDAFTSSPTLREWPVLAPENIPPRLSSKRSSLPTRSAVNSGARTPSKGKEGSRVKRLSWHSSASGSSSGTGPILTISDDADAIILGQRDSIPAVPAIPAVLPERSPQPRSLGALTSRIAKATTSRSSLSITTASPVSNTTELTANGSPVVKISPIRSMQPARKPSLDAHSPKSPLSQSSTFSDATHVSMTPKATPDVERSISPISDRSATPTPEPRPVLELRDVSESPVDCVKSHQVLPKDPPEPVIVPESDDSLSISKVRKTAPIPDNAIAKLSLINHTGQDDSTPNASAVELGTSSLPHAELSRDTTSTRDPSKPRPSETATSIRIDSPSGRGTPKGRQPRRRQFTPMVSSSPTEDTTPEPHDDETLASKVKAKRSIRGLFKRDKTRAKTPETNASKQGFMSNTRSSLAKVMRDSKSLSKDHLPRKTEPKPETESDYTVNKKGSQPGIFAAFGNGRVTPAKEQMPERPHTANEMLHGIVKRIDAQPENSPERLRHVRIAECIILAADHSRKANTSAMEAKECAREAESHANRATLAVTRLHQLLDETEIDAHSMRNIISLANRAERDASREETRRGFMPSWRTAC